MLGRSQRYFEAAERAYDRAVALIRELDQAFQSEVFLEDPEARYDTQITLYQFDVILQALLLNMALCDGNFHRLEKRLILKITDYGDLLAYLRQETSGAIDLEWDGIARMDPETREVLLKRLPRILEGTCRSFVLPLARADGAETAVDFLQQLEGYLREIAAALGYVDGNRDDRETDVFNEQLDHLLVERWKSIKAEV